MVELKKTPSKRASADGRLSSEFEAARAAALDALTSHAHDPSRYRDAVGSTPSPQSTPHLPRASDSDGSARSMLSTWAMAAPKAKKEDGRSAGLSRSPSSQALPPAQVAGPGIRRQQSPDAARREVLQAAPNVLDATRTCRRSMLHEFLVHFEDELLFLVCDTITVLATPFSG